MINIALKHYIYDIGLSILFDSLYKNLIIPNITPIIDNKTITIENPMFYIILHDISGNVDTCVDLCTEIVSDILFMDMTLVGSYIKYKYNIECTLIPR